MCPQQQLFERLSKVRGVFFFTQARLAPLPLSKKHASFPDSIPLTPILPNPRLPSIPKLPFAECSLLDDRRSVRSLVDRDRDIAGEALVLEHRLEGRSCCCNVVGV